MTQPNPTDPAATPTSDPGAVPPVAPPATTDAPPVADAPPAASPPASSDTPSFARGDLIVHEWHDETTNADVTHYGLVTETGTVVVEDGSEKDAASFLVLGDAVTGMIPVSELRKLER